MAIQSFLILYFAITSLYLSFAYPTSPEINVLDFGAKPDGLTDSTQAFLSAWNQACGSVNPITILVPAGKFLLQQAVFQGKSCENRGIAIRIDGTIIAPEDYGVIGRSDKWIAFENVVGVSIYGGVIDARGGSLWNCKRNHNRNCPTGAKSLVFSESRDIEINGLTSLNSQMFHVVINSCENVKINGVRTFAPGDSPNTDGVHVQSSHAVTILNSKMSTGDDCISIGPGSSGLWIENIACGPGHGISIGSLGKEEDENGVQNVTVRNVVFSGTQNGVRIKTWGKPSRCYVKDIVFQHALMNNVKNPIIIDQNYCPDKPCNDNQESGVKISDVSYEDIHGTSATEMGVILDCSKENPCTGIRLDGVKLSYRNRPAEASCVNADGEAYDVVQRNTCL